MNLHTRLVPDAILMQARLVGQIPRMRLSPKVPLFHVRVTTTGAKRDPRMPDRNQTPFPNIFRETVNRYVDSVSPEVKGGHSHGEHQQGH